MKVAALFCVFFQFFATVAGAVSPHHVNATDYACLQLQLFLQPNTHIFLDSDEQKIHWDLEFCGNCTDDLIRSEARLTTLSDFPKGSPHFYEFKDQLFKLPSVDSKLPYLLRWNGNGNSFFQYSQTHNIREELEKRLHKACNSDSTFDSHQMLESFTGDAECIRHETAVMIAAILDKPIGAGAIYELENRGENFMDTCRKISNMNLLQRSELETKFIANSAMKALHSIWSPQIETRQDAPHGNVR
jgi:hypothetical protein